MTTSSTSATAANPWSAILSNSTVAPPSTSTSSTGSTGSGSATGGTSSASSSSSAGSTSGSQNLQQTFLQLLVAQMNNQDPLNPMDSTQLTSQLAQISTVTGINNLNTNISQLLTQLQQSATIQSGMLTGHNVMVAGSGLNLASNSNGSGASAVGGIDLGSAAQNVTVTVSDSSGNVVQTLNLGPMSAGFQDFAWDGSTSSGSAAPAGNYQFSVTATGSGGASVTASPYNLQPVIGAVPQSNGTTQLMLGNGSQVPYTSVMQIM